MCTCVFTCVRVEHLLFSRLYSLCVAQRTPSNITLLGGRLPQQTATNFVVLKPQFCRLKSKMGLTGLVPSGGSEGLFLAFSSF